MKCTSCGYNIRPVVAIDIDGTLGDYHGHFLDFAEQYLAWPGEPDYTRYNGTESFKDWFCGEYGVSHRTWHDIKLAYRQGGMKRSMRMFDDADVLCKAMITMGAELWLTTTRPYLRLDNVDPDTRFWLLKKRIPFHHLLYDEDKYEKLAEQVDPARVVAVVDDQPEQIQEAEQCFGWRIPIQKKGWYNEATNPVGLESLKDIERIIVERIIKWKDDNDG